jgi:hypothetical protein
VTDKIIYDNSPRGFVYEETGQVETEVSPVLVPKATEEDLDASTEAAAAALAAHAVLRTGMHGFSFGSGAPATTPLVNEMYFDYTNGETYYCFVAGAWRNLTKTHSDLMTGMHGFTSGAGAPGGTPVVGQTYWDNTNKKLYHCFVAGTWVDIVKVAYDLADTANSTANSAYGLADSAYDFAIEVNKGAYAGIGGNGGLPVPDSTMTLVYSSVFYLDYPCYLLLSDSRNARIKINEIDGKFMIHLSGSVACSEANFRLQHFVCLNGNPIDLIYSTITPMDVGVWHTIDAHGIVELTNNDVIEVYVLHNFGSDVTIEYDPINLTVDLLGKNV